MSTPSTVSSTVVSGNQYLLKKDRVTVANELLEANKTDGTTNLDKKGRGTSTQEEKKVLSESVDFSQVKEKKTLLGRIFKPNTTIKFNYTEQDGTEGTTVIKARETKESRHNSKVLNSEQKQNTKAHAHLASAGEDLQLAEAEYKVAQDQTNISRSDLEAKAKKYQEAQLKYEQAQQKAKTETEQPSAPPTERDKWKAKETDVNGDVTGKSKGSHVVKYKKPEAVKTENTEVESAETEYLKAKQEMEEAQLKYSNDAQKMNSVEKKLHKAQDKYKDAEDKVAKEDAELQKAQGDAGCKQYKVKAKGKEVYDGSDDPNSAIDYQKDKFKFKGIISSCDDYGTPKREPVDIEPIKPIEPKLLPVPEIKIPPIKIPPIEIKPQPNKIETVNNFDSHDGFEIKRDAQGNATEMVNKKNHVTNAQSLGAVLFSGHAESKATLNTVGKKDAKRDEHITQMYKDFNVNGGDDVDEQDMQTFSRLYQPNAEKADPNIRTKAPFVHNQNPYVTNAFKKIDADGNGKVSQAEFKAYIDAHSGDDAAVFQPE